MRRLIALLAPAASPRRTRRYRPAVDGRVDPGRSLTALLRFIGEPARLAYRRRRLRPRRLVLLVDVSGSMAAYADALLRFAHAAVRCRPSATEAFTFGTRLTRVTRALRHRDPDVALARGGRGDPGLERRHPAGGVAAARSCAGTGIRGSPAARWWWSSATAGSAGIRRRWRRPSRGCAGSRTA